MFLREPQLPKNNRKTTVMPLATNFVPMTLRAPLTTFSVPPINLATQLAPSNL